MKDSFTIRHYVPETDLSPLSRMLTEIESIDRDGEDTSEEYLRAALSWRNYRPDRDVWVAESDGRKEAISSWRFACHSSSGLEDISSVTAFSSDRSA